MDTLDQRMAVSQMGAHEILALLRTVWNFKIMNLYFGFFPWDYGRMRVTGPEDSGTIDKAGLLCMQTQKCSFSVCLYILKQSHR